ncbi:MAG TPA: hypothetical protein VGE24_05880 [Emticicia sp.]
MAQCPPELSGWAGRILDTLPETGYATTGSIVTFLQYNLYRLNAAISTDFNLSGECIVPDMSQQISGIYTAMYYCTYLQKRAAANLGSAAYAWQEVENHDQGRIRRPSATSIAQEYRLQAAECKTELQSLIDEYNNGQFGGALGMVIYDQRGPNNYPLPAMSLGFRYCGYFSNFNPIFE